MPGLVIASFLGSSLSAAGVRLDSLCPAGINLVTMYNCVIFDIDGTMTDSERAVRLALAELMKEEFGREYSPDEINFTFGVPGEDSLRTLGFSHPEEADRKWVKLMMENFHLVKLFPGIEELVRGLRERGVRLGIVTSKTREEYIKEFELPYPELAACFETYICADDTLRHKPFPDPLLECLKRMDCESHDALYVGDTVFDFRCADSAGADFALAVWGASTREGITARYYPEQPMNLLRCIEEIQTPWRKP